MKTTTWNIQDYLKTTEDIANYLEAALEENDNKYLKIAVQDAIVALKRKEKKNDNGKYSSKNSN